MNDPASRPAPARPITRRAALAAGVGAVAALTAQSRLASADTSGTRRAKHVILIGWDGFDPAYLKLVDTPNLDELAGRGSLSSTSGTFPTISNPSWTTIATGAWPRTHLNTAYFIDPSSGLAVSQTRTMESQSIAEAVTAAGGTVASVQFYSVQNHGTVFGDPRALYVQPGGSNAVRVDVAIDILHGRPVQSGSTMVTVEEPPTLLAVYGSDLDALGHAEGAEAPGMGATLAALDADLGRLVQATKDVGIYGDTAFVLLGDHGMTTFTRGFGGDVLAALTGAGFTPEFVSPGAAPSPQTDIAMVVGGATNLYVLGATRMDEGIARARSVLESVEQVQHIYDRDDLDAFQASPLLGDLVAEPTAGWSFAVTDPDGPRGFHGRTGELEAVLLLAGRGVRRGACPVRARHVDIAPTIAALLGIPAPAQTEGRVLTEALHRLT